jgi:hypothetical protein
MEVKIIRSKRRKKTVEGRLESGVLAVRAPARISDAELAPIIDNLKAKVEKKLRRHQQKSDQALEARARELNRRYFGGKLTWGSIRYVTNQNKRFGSCTPDYGTIASAGTHAGLGARLRPRPRAGPPDRAQSLTRLLGPGQPLPQNRASAGLFDGHWYGSR